MAVAFSILLTQDVRKLGRCGDKVVVKPGYARHFLLKKKMAVLATKENIAQFEANRAEYEERQRSLLKDATALAERLAGFEVRFERQTSPDGALYGSVTARDVATALQNEGFKAIHEGHVVLVSPFKRVGDYPVVLHLVHGVEVTVTVHVLRQEDSTRH